MTEETNESNNKLVSFSEFLEKHPPNSTTSVTGLCSSRSVNASFTVYDLKKPQLILHCDSEVCNGERYFRCTDPEDIKLFSHRSSNIFLEYICSNCRNSRKTFSIIAKPETGESGVVYKFGELPSFGPPSPAKLIKIIGPDRDLFLKGRKCENQGLGIGAFVYYRRVVENQKDRLFDQILKVAQKSKLNESDIDVIEKAKSETQFKKALEMAKNAIPEKLFINHHNPLTLLHKALSDGVHNKDDEECLELAGCIRIVLSDLSERLDQALKEEAELNNAINKLLSSKKERN